MNIFFLLFYCFQLIRTQDLQSKEQFISRQSDRVQIMYVQALNQSLSKGDSVTNTFDFPKPFQNIPKAMLSIQSYHTNINIPQSFKLSIQSMTLNKITVKIESLETSIYELKIGILAVDYPFVEVFTNTLAPKQTAIHKVDYKIQSYVTFFTSFQASGCVFLEFNLDSSQEDDYSIKVQASKFNCLSSLDYNLLVIYYNITNFPDMKYYYYQFTTFSNKIDSDIQVKTNLKSPDTGFYGIKDMCIGSVLSFGIFFNPSNQSQPIQNGSYSFYTDKKRYLIYYANSQVLDLLKLECPPGQYLYKENCIKSAYNGIYCKNNPNVCFDCDSKCLACQNSATNCLKCATSLYFYQNKCFYDKQPGTYCDDNKICQTCNLEVCQECENDANYCTSCVQGYYFYKNFCSQNQPHNTYCEFDTSLNYYKCHPCGDSKCKKCSGIIPNQCIECDDNIYLYQQACTSEQPQQTFCTNYICQPCFNLCNTCFGANQNECLSCISNYQLNLMTNLCEISICQDGYYPDKNLNSCQQCKKGCDKCSQFSVCTECSTIINSNGVVQQYILDEMLQICNLSCLEGQYLDSQTNECSSCDKSCLTCNGKTNQNCLSCINGAQINAQGMCQCQNPNEGFSDDFKQCIPCQVKNCDKCVYSNTCELCQELAYLNPEKNQCICSDGYFYSDSYKKCIKCIQSSCLACLSNGITCTKCQKGFLLTQQSICTYCNNYKYSSDGKNCDSKCPNFCEVCTERDQCIQYSKGDPDVIPNNLCHHSCQSCSGLTEFDCQMCSSKTRNYNHQKRECECISGYIESNQQDCSKIQQVEPFIQNMAYNTNKIFYFVQSALIFLNLSPSLIYSYQIQQYLGNIYYVYNSDKSANNLFSQYTKYNLNNLFYHLIFPKSGSNSTNLDSIDQSQDYQSEMNNLTKARRNLSFKYSNGSQFHHDLKILLENKNFNRNLQDVNQIELPTIQEYNDSLKVQIQSKFFQSSIVPLSATLFMFTLSLTIHIYQLKSQKQLKFGYIVKWNSVLFFIQINFNYLLMQSFNIDLRQQDIMDITTLVAFWSFYSSFLAFLAFNIYKQNYYEKSFLLTNYYYQNQNKYSQYYFILMQIKQMIICLVFSFIKDKFIYSIWTIVSIQLADIIIKFLKKPFRYVIDFLTTVSFDIIFTIILILFGVILLVSNQDTKILCYTGIQILLIIITFLNILVIIHKVIFLILKRKNRGKKLSINGLSYKNQQKNTNKALKLLKFKKKSLEQLELSIQVVKWQKNPIIQQKESSLNQSLCQ
ncbi:hypothetical protein ABPG74_007687 [Tetrahymena malaccensis]